MLSSFPVIYGIDPHSSSTTQDHNLGSQGVDQFGDLYRYVKASEALTAGMLVCGKDIGTTQVNLSVAVAASAGAKEISITLGAAAVTANEYSEGYIVFNDVSPEGITVRIGSHPASAGSAAIVFKLLEPLPESVTTSSQVTLVHNQWFVQTTATQTNIPAGFCGVDVASGSFGWVKSRGVVAALSDENGTVGRALTIGSSTAGAVEERDDMLEATDGNRFLLEPTVGYQMVAMVDGEHNAVYATID
jgi:hypothetical protein